MNIVKKIVFNNKILWSIAYPIHKLKQEIILWIKTKKMLDDTMQLTQHKIYYLGIPAHNNLGDLAQGMCIRKWLQKHYPNKKVIEIETNALVNTHFSLLNKFKEIYNVQNDMIVFQSGYTTTDLGGYADEMHRAVMKAVPDAKMLMMPQTIFFRDKENKKRTSKVYNSMRHMLFLARDEVSYEMALKMFPDIKVKLFPDIVTTLIGTKTFEYKRDGIMMCCRDDSEKLYSEEEIIHLKHRLESIGKVNNTDTTKRNAGTDIVKNFKDHIENEIKSYAHYKIMITDRYHGTILSLVAGTPVIIIKTNDHKVITGADWFKDVYDEYVYIADDLDDAFNIAKKLYVKEFKYKLNPYFEKEYYDKLPSLFEKEVN